MTEMWNRARFGCIQRDGFQLRPLNRTVLTKVDGPPVRTKKGDVRAPLDAQFVTIQTYAQFTSFTQWHRFDLAGGSRPFLIDLWLWGQWRQVRARFTNEWKVTRQAFDTYQLNCVFEIERESIT